METFGVGMAGAGMIGTVHAEALDEIEGARLVAVAAAHEATGRKLAETHRKTLRIAANVNGDTKRPRLTRQRRLIDARTIVRGSLFADAEIGHHTDDLIP